MRKPSRPSGTGARKRERLLFRPRGEGGETGSTSCPSQRGRHTPSRVASRTLASRTGPESVLRSPKLSTAYGNALTTSRETRPAAALGRMPPPPPVAVVHPPSPAPAEAESASVTKAAAAAASSASNDDDNDDVQGGSGAQDAAAWDALVKRYEDGTCATDMTTAPVRRPDDLVFEADKAPPPPRDCSTAPPAPPEGADVDFAREFYLREGYMPALKSRASSPLIPLPLAAVAPALTNQPLPLSFFSPRARAPPRPEEVLALRHWPRPGHRRPGVARTRRLRRRVRRRQHCPRGPCPARVDERVGRQRGQRRRAAPRRAPHGVLLPARHGKAAERRVLPDPRHDARLALQAQPARARRRGAHRFLRIFQCAVFCSHRGEGARRLTLDFLRRHLPSLGLSVSFSRLCRSRSRHTSRWLALPAPPKAATEIDRAARAHAQAVCDHGRQRVCVPLAFGRAVLATPN